MQSALTFLVIVAGSAVDDAKKPDVAALIKRLGSSLSSEVIAAAGELEKLGPGAKDAVPALIDAFKKASFADTIRATGRALGKIGPEAKQAVPVLVERLKGGPIVQERLAIIEALGEFGPTAKDATLTLNQIARNSLGEERRAAQTALRKIQVRAKDKP